MKKVSKPPFFYSIPEFMQVLSQPSRMAGSLTSDHSLIGLLDLASLAELQTRFPSGLSAGFYVVIFVRSYNENVPYSQRFREANNACLSFLEPGKLLQSRDLAGDREGIVLLIQEDLFRGHPLEKVIRGYEFWSYATSEALFLSDNERQQVQLLIDGIGNQLQQPAPDSTDMLASMLEEVLNLGDRLYQLQFQRRRLAHQDLFGRMGNLLHDYLEKGHALLKGIPSAEWLSARLGVSKAYLDTMLHSLRGHDLQRQLMDFLVERAKHLLQYSELTPAEVAYNLGFEDFGSFTKIFRQRTRQSPGAYRGSLA